MPDSPEEKPAAVIDFRGKPGDRALLIGGALVGMEGVIDTVNTGKQTVILKVDLLGSDTPLEVGFEDVRIL